MKKIAIIVFCVGLVSVLFFGTSLYQSVTGDALGGGYGVLFIGYPLILLSIVLFVISLFTHRQK